MVGRGLVNVILVIHFIQAPSYIIITMGNNQFIEKNIAGKIKWDTKLLNDLCKASGVKNPITIKINVIRLFMILKL